MNARDVDRRIVYIRAEDLLPLYFRVIGGEFHPVLAIYSSDGTEYHGYTIALGDKVKIRISGHERLCMINEYVDLTEVPWAFESKGSLVEQTQSKAPR